MTLGRRQFLHLAAGAAALPILPRAAVAQAYPTQTVRVIVPGPPGGPPDLVGRLLGQWLQDRLGQSFVVENRAGGGTNIGTEAVVRATPDGHTLLMLSHANTINASLFEGKLKFNFMRDIAPVAMVMNQPNAVVVNPAFPAKTVPELIAYAKSNPGKINMASAGRGTSSHVAGELFKMMAQVDMMHVPYNGGPPALTDLLAGNVQITFNAMPSVIDHIKTGRLRALGVTSAQRFPALPDVPSVSDFVPGYEASGWIGVGAPAGTPSAIIDRLNSEINAALRDAKVSARLADLGGTVIPMSGAEFGKFLADDMEKWGKVIQAANLRAD